MKTAITKSVNLFHILSPIETKLCERTYVPRQMREAVARNSTSSPPPPPSLSLADALTNEAREYFEICLKSLCLSVEMQVLANSFSRAARLRGKQRDSRLARSEGHGGAD